MLVMVPGEPSAVGREVAVKFWGRDMMLPLCTQYIEVESYANTEKLCEGVGKVVGVALVMGVRWTIPQKPLLLSVSVKKTLLGFTT
jgi:hypothetical protein